MDLFTLMAAGFMTGTGVTLIVFIVVDLLMETTS